MYVPPRPSVADDPHYGIRLGLTGALSFGAVALLDPAMPTVMAALPVGLIAGQRKAFAPVRVIAAPVMVCVMAALMAWFVNVFQPLPVVYAGTMWLVYFLGFGMILGTGAPFGMLLVIMAVLFSVVGMSGSAAVAVLRDAFFATSLVALVVIPLAYALVPARTREMQVDTPVPPGGDAVMGAAIRASVLLALSFWLYAVMPPSDMMLAIMAAMVLVFPTRRAVFFEARQRMRATLYGSALAVAVVAVYPLSPKLPILLGLVFLAGLWVGTKVLHDPRPHMAYQNAYPAALALIAGALSTQDLGQAVVSRVLLTLAGAFTAAYLVAILDHLTGWRTRAAATVTDGAA
ncbi:FUSC family protein [Roseovarius sp. SCSIO 43702]|uniref:FUSC family protein n=1 Tax=Roseovarius sp. SCSIO 43702 TaxID=2823043 RepID=UPI001C73B5FA|nr:FUSC family protein [Roseovarius sp. SCSIO 43702]QYX56325.1 FUSC family protein [Roseovarius sp. SCSIO 43702]